MFGSSEPKSLPRDPTESHRIEARLAQHWHNFGGAAEPRRSDPEPVSIGARVRLAPHRASGTWAINRGVAANEGQADGTGRDIECRSIEYRGYDQPEQRWDGEAEPGEDQAGVTSGNLVGRPVHPRRHVVGAFGHPAVPKRSHRVTPSHGCRAARADAARWPVGMGGSRPSLIARFRPDRPRRCSYRCRSALGTAIGSGRRAARRS